MSFEAHCVSLYLKVLVNMVLDSENQHLLFIHLGRQAVHNMKPKREVIITCVDMFCCFCL